MKQERDLNFGSLSDSVRKSVKESELEAERLEQMILYDSGQKIFPVESVEKLDRVANAEINMRTYIEIIAGNISETADSLILKICSHF